MHPDCLTESARVFAPLILLAYFIAIFVEVGVAKLLKRDLYDMDDTIQNFLMFFANRMMGGLGGAFMFSILDSVSRNIPWHLSGPLGLLATFLVVDFLFYAQHRVFHSDSVFAPFHEIHHTSEHYNFSTTLRASVFLPFVNPLFYLPAVFLGADALSIILCFSFIQVYQFFLHTQLAPKLGALEGLINTPEAHRIHHGNRRSQYESNLGGVLMIWDHIFGSYSEKNKSLVYGIKGVVPQKNFFVAQVYPFYSYFKRKTSSEKAIESTVESEQSF